MDRLIEYSKNGVKLYEGGFETGVYSGKGCRYFPGGGRYEGSFLAGKPVGWLSGYDADGNLVYEGHWENDEFQGRAGIFPMGKRYMRESSPIISLRAKDWNIKTARLPIGAAMCAAAGKAWAFCTKTESPGTRANSAKTGCMEESMRFKTDGYWQNVCIRMAFCGTRSGIPFLTESLI